MQENNTKKYRFISLFVIFNIVIMLFFVIIYKIQRPSIVFSVQKNELHDNSENGQMQNMITRLMIKLKENPNDIEALKGLGFIFTEMRAWDKASVFLEKAINLMPNDRDIIVKLATCYLFLEKYNEGANLLEKLIQMEPENYMAKFNLAYLYGFILNNKQRAKDLFDELIKQRDIPANLMEKIKESINKLEKQ